MVAIALKDLWSLATEGTQEPLLKVMLQPQPQRGGKMLCRPFGTNFAAILYRGFASLHPCLWSNSPSGFHRTARILLSKECLGERSFLDIRSMRFTH